MFTEPSDNRHSNPNELEVHRPTRDADHNSQLVHRDGGDGGDILFPSLNDGITLLDINTGRGVPVLQSLVLDHLLMNEGPAYWVDANGHASTTGLARIAPSRRIMDRIHVARGFTAYQHYAAICDLPAAVNQHIRQVTEERRASGGWRKVKNDSDSPETPSLIVAPVIDAQYRQDDTLPQEHALTLQARVLARLASLADGYDASVLVTRTTSDEFTAAVETAASHHLTCERTEMGPRFVGDEFESLVYPVDNGSYYQTTLTYWRQLLGARAEQVGLGRAHSESVSNTAPNNIGSTKTLENGTASLTTNPLMDAWKSAASTGAR